MSPMRVFLWSRMAITIPFNDNNPIGNRSNWPFSEKWSFLLFPHSRCAIGRNCIFLIRYYSCFTELDIWIIESQLWRYDYDWCRLWWSMCKQYISFEAIRSGWATRGECVHEAHEHIFYQCWSASAEHGFLNSEKTTQRVSTTNHLVESSAGFYHDLNTMWLIRNLWRSDATERHERWDAKSRVEEKRKKKVIKKP